MDGWMDGRIGLSTGGSSTVQYSTHLHRNITQNNTINLGRVRAIIDTNGKPRTN